MSAFYNFPPTPLCRCEYGDSRAGPFGAGGRVRRGHEQQPGAGHGAPPGRPAPAHPPPEGSTQQDPGQPAPVGSAIIS